MKNVYINISAVEKLLPHLNSVTAAINKNAIFVNSKGIMDKSYYILTPLYTVEIYPFKGPNPKYGGPSLYITLRDEKTGDLYAAYLRKKKEDEMPLYMMAKRLYKKAKFHSRGEYYDHWEGL